MRKESKYNKTLLDLAEVLLEDKNTLSIKVSGNSMFPSLKEGDICFEEKCHISDLKIGDIIACRRNNFFIMHRLKRLTKDNNGRYILEMRGDNVLQYDAPFFEDEFVAKLLYFNRNGKIHQADSRSMKFKKCIDNLFHPVSCRLSHMWLFGKNALNLFKNSSHSLRTNIRHLLRGSEKIFRTNAMLAVLRGVVPLGVIVCIRFLIDFVTRGSIQTGQDRTLFFILLAVTAFLFLAGGVLSQLSDYFSEKMSQSVTRKVYADLHRKHIRLSLSEFENSEKLDKMHRAVQEASYRPVRILQSALGLIRTVSAGIILLGLFFWVRWYLIFILLVAVVPDALVRIIHSRKLYRMKESQIAAEREKYYYSRVLTGYPFAKELRLFGFARYFLRLFDRKQDQLFAEKLALSRQDTIRSVLAQTFGVLLIFASLGIVSYLSVSGRMSVGTVVLFFFAFQRGYSILSEFFRSVTGLVEDNAYLDDLLGFLHSENDVQPAASDGKSFTLTNDIRFENVDFRYPGSKRDALKGVNIRIPAGKTVALAGENGSGKTTLVKLLCGFHQPSAGRVLIDSADIREIGQQQLLANITAVFQDFALYQVSAMDNILLGDSAKPSDPEEAKRAATVTGMNEILENLPEGYLTRLGHLFKDSEELSIGQWQKLAIARAFYRDAPLLLMDEPSSALDANSEQQIIGNLKTLAKDKTTLIVSHRLSTVQWADYIYLLHEGTVAEAGTHEELIKLGGKYYTMFIKSRE